MGDSSVLMKPELINMLRGIADPPGNIPKALSSDNSTETVP